MFLMFLSSFEHKFTVLYVIAYECTHPFGAKDENVYFIKPTAYDLETQRVAYFECLIIFYRYNMQN